MLILVLMAMLLASMNYSNNLGYIFCFLIASLMLVGFLHTRNNLKGLVITNIQTRPVFAGDMIEFTLVLENHSRVARVAIYAQCLHHLSKKSLPDKRHSGLDPEPRVLSRGPKSWIPAPAPDSDPGFAGMTTLGKIPVVGQTQKEHLLQKSSLTPLS